MRCPVQVSVEWIKALVARLTKELARCSPRTLASVAWSLASLDCCPHPRWMGYFQQVRAADRQHL
jgi:hypothetical protein